MPPRRLRRPDTLAFRKGPWSSSEDDSLRRRVGIHGAQNWQDISGHVRTRCPKQCRERYHQILNPKLRKSPISDAEGDRILELHRLLGPKWAQIARHLDNRPDNAVKNWFNGQRTRDEKRRKQDARTAHRPDPLSLHDGLPTDTPFHSALPSPMTDLSHDGTDATEGEASSPGGPAPSLTSASTTSGRSAWSPGNPSAWPPGGDLRDPTLLLPAPGSWAGVKPDGPLPSNVPSGIPDGPDGPDGIPGGPEPVLPPWPAWNAGVRVREAYDEMVLHRLR